VIHFLEQLLKLFLLHGQGQCLIERHLRLWDVSLIGYEVQSWREVLNDTNQALAVIDRARLQVESFRKESLVEPSSQILNLLL
jgi:hypothetical protein